VAFPVLHRNNQTLVHQVLYIFHKYLHHFQNAIYSGSILSRLLKQCFQYFLFLPEHYLNNYVLEKFYIYIKNIGDNFIIKDD